MFIVIIIIILTSCSDSRSVRHDLHNMVSRTLCAVGVCAHFTTRGLYTVSIRTNIRKKLSPMTERNSIALARKRTSTVSISKSNARAYLSFSPYIHYEFVKRRIKHDRNIRFIIITYFLFLIHLGF